MQKLIFYQNNNYENPGDQVLKYIDRVRLNHQTLKTL